MALSLRHARKKYTDHIIIIIYRKYKHSIKDEQNFNLYDNSAGTSTLFEARTGTLQLNDTKRHTHTSASGETSCELCGYHMIMKIQNIFFYIVLLSRKQE